MELVIVSKRDNLEKATQVLKERAVKEGLTIGEVVHESQFDIELRSVVHKYTTEAV
jgi:hydrogenase maturation factor